MKSTRLYFLFIIILFSSCKKEYEETTKIFSLSSFTTLNINSVFSIYLVQDTIYSIEIIADKNTINNIDVNLDEAVLTLTDNNKQKWMNPTDNKIKVYVHAPQLQQINPNASYSIQSVDTITYNLSIVNQPAVKLSEIELTLKNNSFYYWNNYMSGGMLLLHGRCNDFNINNYALHLVNTVDLKAQSGFLSNYAKADCKVYVTQQLTCDLDGQGNIYVYGNPTEIIVHEQKSTGQVIRMD